MQEEFVCRRELDVFKGLRLVSTWVLGERDLCTELGVMGNPLSFFFFLNVRAPPEIYPLPLHAALPIFAAERPRGAAAPSGGARSDSARAGAHRRGRHRRDPRGAGGARCPGGTLGVGGCRDARGGR